MIASVARSRAAAVERDDAISLAWAGRDPRRLPGSLVTGPKAVSVLGWANARVALDDPLRRPVVSQFEIGSA